MDTETGLGHLGAVLTRQVLGHTGRNVVAFSRVLEPRSVGHHQVRCLDLGGHLRQRERDGLMLRDGFAESTAFLGVARGEFKRA